MAIFKCKMCGGSIEFNPGETVGVCDSCGTKQTLPRLDDDKKANLYDRANHFRRNNDYDKAMGIYEQVLSEDSTDAEAYWSLVLCKYGIEYVEDPATHKRVPTVNRVQYTSIFADEDYKSALKYADGYQKEIYEEEAKAIDEIQKGILAISKKEEPFDVFICYKETDDGGRRTPDSVLANDLYHQLTQEGFKVFFAKITLEDKLGQEYEPYIFAALNSAPVMVCLGTKPEYFNAVWVRNEWSRYLALIKKGEKKILIPAYKDMDPYDLPDEFSHLQAQDMSKLGFMQDLIRGIKKILDSGDSDAKKQSGSGSATSESFDVDKNLKRAFLFIEDEKDEEAAELLEKVIDADPQNVKAYIGKLLLEAGVKTEDKLVDADTIIFDSKNLDRAIRFADDDLKQKLTEIKFENAYRVGQKRFEKATADSDFEFAKAAFEKVPEYKDSAAMIEQCMQKGQSAKTAKTYTDALSLMSNATAVSNGSIENLNKAITKFESVIDYEDSEKKIDECKRRIEEIKAGIEANKKKTKKLAIIAGIAIVVLIAFIIVLKTVIIPSSNYNKAIDMMKAGDYESARTVFSEMMDYKDSSDQYKECTYQVATKYLEAKDLDNSNPLFEEIKDYKDSADKIHYHDWKETKVVDATCEKEGSKELVCACGETKTEDIAALGHDWKEATCTEAKKCKLCGETSGSALGHTNGVKCERCGEVLFKKLTYSGSNQDIVKGINLPEGNFIIKAHYTGQGNFAAVFYSSEGDEHYDRVANEIGSCDVQVKVNGPATNGYIEVELAKGSWTFTIEAM